jgi:hypothetical protein
VEGSSALRGALGGEERWLSVGAPQSARRAGAARRWYAMSSAMMPKERRFAKRPRPTSSIIALVFWRGCDGSARAVDQLEGVLELLAKE